MKAFIYSDQLEEQIKADKNYYNFGLAQIKEQGFAQHSINSEVVFVPNIILYCLLGTHSYLAYNRLSQELEPYDNKAIREAFLKGYLEGQKGFEERFDFPETLLDKKKAAAIFKRLESDLSKDELLKDKKILTLKPLTLIELEFERFGKACGFYFSVQSFLDKYSVEYEAYSMLEQKQLILNNPKVIEVDADRIRKELVDLGFYNLSYMDSLTDDNKAILLEKLSSLKLKEAIPYLEKIGFFNFLVKEHGETEANKKIQKVYQRKTRDDYGTNCRKFRKSLVQKPQRTSEDSSIYIPEALKFLRNLN